MIQWGELGPDGAKTFPLHPGQVRVMRSKARFTAAIAGTGGGKTCLGPVWVARRINQLIELGMSPVWGLVVAPTYQILNRATVPTMEETFKGTDLEGHYSEGKKQYILPGQLGVIWTLSADNPEGLEGGQFHFAWLDEGGQLSKQAWVAVQGRVGLHKAPVLITTTPYRLNWLKEEVVDRYKAGDKNYCVVSWSSTENPMYPVEEYERAKATMPPALFRMRYDGVFGATEGLIFSSFEHDYNVRPVNYDPKKPILVGVDFNVNPMCWVLAHRHGDVLEVFDEIFYRNTTTEWTVNLLTSRYSTHEGGFQFYGDATGRARKTSAAQTDYAIIAANKKLIQLGRTFHVPNANPQVVDRFAATNARLKNANGDHNLFIDPRCEYLIRDLETRFYKEGTREPDDKGDAGHMTDALGYIIHRIWPIRMRIDGYGKQKVIITKGVA